MLIGGQPPRSLCFFSQTAAASKIARCRPVGRSVLGPRTQTLQIVPPVLAAGSGSAHCKPGEYARSGILTAECHAAGGGCVTWRRAIREPLPARKTCWVPLSSAGRIGRRLLT